MKTYRIAGLTVHMDTWGRTLAQAKPYLVADTDQADVTVTSFDPSAYENSTKEALDLGEYNTTAQVFYFHLLKFHGLMVHASAVVMDGKAYLFLPKAEPVSPPILPSGSRCSVKTGQKF